MEPMYRRQHTEMRTRTYKTPGEISSYKKKFLKRSGVCLLLLCVCLMIKTGHSPKLVMAKKIVDAVLNTSTKFTQIPAQIHSATNALLQKDEPETGSKEELLVHLTKPVDAPITSPFGLRTDPNKGGEEAFHYGLDLGAQQGDKIKCAANGTVEEAGENSEYGKFITVRHSDTVTTLYAHCAELLPQTGDAVNAGQIIATVGSTGNATGPHLHFEIRDGETWLDPAKFLDFN